MKLREIERKDISAWSAMRTALWPDTSDGHMVEIEDYFAGTSIDIAMCYVVEVEMDLVGFVELNIRNFAEGSRQSKVPFVEAWYVSPAHQAKGYGKALMQQAEKWAIENGYSELASDTEIHNEKSIAMHKHLGFDETERVVCFLKRVLDASESKKG